MVYFFRCTFVSGRVCIVSGITLNNALSKVRVFGALASFPEQLGYRELQVERNRGVQVVQRREDLYPERLRRLLRFCAKVNRDIRDFGRDSVYVGLLRKKNVEIREEFGPEFTIVG